MKPSDIEEAPSKLEAAARALSWARGDWFSMPNDAGVKDMIAELRAADRAQTINGAAEAVAAHQAAGNADSPSLHPDGCVSFDTPMSAAPPSASQKASPEPVARKPFAYAYRRLVDGHKGGVYLVMVDPRPFPNNDVAPVCEVYELYTHPPEADELLRRWLTNEEPSEAVRLMRETSAYLKAREGK